MRDGPVVASSDWLSPSRHLEPLRPPVPPPRSNPLEALAGATGRSLNKGQIAALEGAGGYTLPPSHRAGPGPVKQVEKFGFHFLSQSQYPSLSSCVRLGSGTTTLNRISSFVFGCVSSLQTKRTNTFRLGVKLLFDATTKARWNARSSSGSRNNLSLSSLRPSSMYWRHPLEGT